MFDKLNALVARAYLASKREEGQTFVEYALIAVFVGLALITFLGAFTGQIHDALDKIGKAL